jgi:hypothetical protein
MYYPITNGVIQIDEEDLPIISAFKWWTGNHGYAMNNMCLMHRLLCKGNVVHHKNNNRKNNLKSNLEGVDSQSEHIKFHMFGNRHADGKGKVWLNKTKNPEYRCWEVRIMFNGKRKRFGLYENPLTAQLVYNLIWEELNGIQKQ